MRPTVVAVVFALGSLALLPTASAHVGPYIVTGTATLDDLVFKATVQWHGDLLGDHGLVTVRLFTMDANQLVHQALVTAEQEGVTSMPDLCNEVTDIEAHNQASPIVLDLEGAFVENLCTGVTTAHLTGNYLAFALDLAL